MARQPMASQCAGAARAHLDAPIAPLSLFTPIGHFGVGIVNFIEIDCCFANRQWGVAFVETPLRKALRDLIGEPCETTSY